MSLSIYLVSNNKITLDEVSQFLSELNAIDVKNNQKSGQVIQGSSNVWLDFLGSSVLDESDDEELELWAENLGGTANSFFELTIGKGEGSMKLAVMIAKSAMMRWNIIVDDLDESIYNSSNIDFLSISMLSKIVLLLVKMRTLHPEDPSIYRYWENMTSILSKDETETIEFFNSLTDGEMIEDLSAVFDDVSGNLQSKKFIECLEKVKAKFPNAQLHEMIEAAKEQLFDDK